MNKFKQLQKEAEQAIFEGWDFSYLKDRYIEKPTSRKNCSYTRDNMNTEENLKKVNECIQKLKDYFNERKEK